MWKIYDTLIDGIPDGLTVTEAALGPHWAAVLSSEGGVGMGMRYDMISIPSALPGNPAGSPAGLLRGLSLRGLARSAKSWNFVEAAHGVAALNAYYNHPDRAKALGIDISRASRDNEAFLKYRAALTGKKAAVIGHFPYLENLLRPVCALSILERRPSEGDFPDSACEYILAEQDYVFITGSALVNKTLPRLLQLCRGKPAVLVGPSTPLSPALFDFGVYDLSGFVVLDPPRLFTAVREGIEGRHFAAGTMVNFRRGPPAGTPNGGTDGGGGGTPGGGRA